MAKSNRIWGPVGEERMVMVEIRLWYGWMGALSGQKGRSLVSLDGTRATEIWRDCCTFCTMGNSQGLASLILATRALIPNSNTYIN